MNFSHNGTGKVIEIFFKVESKLLNFCFEMMYNIGLHWVISEDGCWWYGTSRNTMHYNRIDYPQFVEVTVRTLTWLEQNMHFACVTQDSYSSEAHHMLFTIYHIHTQDQINSPTQNRPSLRPLIQQSSHQRNFTIKDATLNTEYNQMTTHNSTK